MFLKSITVSLTKSREDKIRLYEYYLHNKERIRQRHKDYYNNSKKRIRGNSKNNRKKQKISLNNPQGRVEKFLHLAKRGPTFVCVVCNRCLYARSIMEFQFNKYNLDLTDVIHKVTKNEVTFICNTCIAILRNPTVSIPQIIKQSVETLQIFETPAEIKNLNRLERLLIARRILFKKVTVTPKGQFPKLKGPICNIPIYISDITNILPHDADSSGLIMVKLKRKLGFRGHVCFSPVSPESVYLALSYLKVKNPYYKDITIDMGTLPSDLTDLVDQSEVDCSGPSDTLKLDENLQHQYQYNLQESLLIPDIPSLEEISIAPGEEKKPNSLISDENCEALTFLCLFPTGKFGHDTQRDVKLRSARYFNQRLLNYTQLFESEADYIFYALSVTQQLKLSSQINIACDSQNAVKQFYRTC